MTTTKLMVEINCPYTHPNVPFAELVERLEEVVRVFLRETNPGEHFEVAVSQQKEKP